MKNVFIVSCISLVLYFCCTISLIARPIILVTIKPYPQTFKIEPEESFEKKIGCNPDKLCSTLLRYAHYPSPLSAGIFATYWGYLTPSDYEGHIRFIRHVTKPELNILIAHYIEPVMMLGNTVHHWIIKPNTRAAFYSIKRKQDAETKLYYWDTHQEEVPYEKPISLDTIIIFADPHYMYIPQGIRITTYDPNLILPDIFAKRGLHRDFQALRTLGITHFFSPVRTFTKTVYDNHYQELLNEN